MDRIDKSGTPRPISSVAEFATSLEQLNADFGRVRGIANAAKHLKLNDIRPVANAPSHAANTRIQTVGGLFGARYFGKNYFGRYFGNVEKVILEGPSGQHMAFSTIAKSVYGMWENLNSRHGWW